MLRLQQGCSCVVVQASGPRDPTDCRTPYGAGTTSTLRELVIGSRARVFGKLPSHSAFAVATAIGQVVAGICTDYIIDTFVVRRDCRL